MKQPGEPIALGDIIGHPMEPHQRYARVTRIRKDNCRAMERIIFRTFNEGDPDNRPTGEYRTGWLVVPWMARA